MSEEYVDIEVNLDQEIADKVNSMTKKELIEKIMAMALEMKIMEAKLQHYAAKTYLMDASLDQAKALINTVMDGWESNRPEKATPPGDEIG